MSIKLIQYIIGLTLLGSAGITHAAQQQLDLRVPAEAVYAPHAATFMLAQNADRYSQAALANTRVKPAAEFEPSLTSASKLHQYLGISTVALAALTVATAPQTCDGPACEPRDVNGTHANLARATVAMAAATMTAGLIAHWDDFKLEDGLADPDNLHVLLAFTGTALLASYAVNQATSSSAPLTHTGMAEAGLLGMVVAVKLTW